MVFTLSEWCHPRMEVISREVCPVHELVHSSRIVSVARQQVNVTRTGLNVVFAIDFDQPAVSIENFDTGQTKIVDVTPCLNNVELELPSSGLVRDLETLLENGKLLSELLVLSLWLGRLLL